jgi:hypothetical protein
VIPPQEATVPWEISIINGTKEQPKPLGSREDVIAAFAESLPGVSLRRSPAPPPELLEHVPLYAREGFLRPSLEAELDSGEMLIRFEANDEPVLQWLIAEVRGNGDPIPVLSALCSSRGWSVIDSSTKSVVDLSAGSGGAEWKRFCEWRDIALSQERRSEK